MIFLAIYLLLFGALMFLSFFDKNKGNLDEKIYWGAGLILFCLAAFKPLGIDNDSLYYVSAYYGQTLVKLESSMEQTFVIISDIIRYTIDIPEAVFFVYALLAIPLKLYAIKRYTQLWSLSLVILMGNYYLLHDLTQIRANVAISLFLWAVLFLAEGKRLTYIGIILIAALFHISALALLPIVIFSNKELTMPWRIFLALLPVVGYIFYFIKIDVVIVSFIPYVQDKLELYEKLRDRGAIGDEINVFDKMFLIKLMIFYFLLYKYDVIKEHCSYSSILMKISPFYFFAFCSLSVLPVFASRVSDLYGVVQIMTTPLLCYTVKPDWLGKAGVCAIGCLLLFFSIAYMGLLILN